VPWNHRLARFAGATGCAAGDRVGLGFLGGQCGVCVWCRHGDFVNCENRPRIGKTVEGGYAEVVVQPRPGELPMPVASRVELYAAIRRDVSRSNRRCGASRRRRRPTSMLC
jgi:threonine dehydrogenase-like Zn-dependent dehydrogenase